MKPLEITGKRYHRLVAVKRVGTTKTGQSVWSFECDCGAVVSKTATHVLQGKHKSCGCFRKEFTTNKNMKHGMNSTPEHRVWARIRGKCYNKNDSGYHKYGARGIRVCERWMYSFENFFADMGKRPTQHHSIDRIDNNGNYEPENCRWATIGVQARNKRRNVFLEKDGVRMCVTDWGNHLGLNPGVISKRLKRGWSVQEALSVKTKLN